MRIPYGSFLKKMKSYEAVDLKSAFICANGWLFEKEEKVSINCHL